MAYRRLARLYHPDLNPRPEAAERMRAINSAYRVLSDPRQRAVYDARRFVRPSPSPSRTVVQAQSRPSARPVVASEPPSELQRHVDRVVAVIGVMLLILLAIYAVLVIPRASQSGQTHTATGTVSDRVRTDGALRSFPGDVLVPPSDLAPFKDLPFLRLDANGQGLARYAVYYGDVTTGLASVSGLIGRASFDAANPRVPNCAADATYCAGPGVGQSANDPPGIEVFRPANLVGDFPAFATHRVCCNGLFWSVSWYEPGPNMSYTIDLSRSVAAQFGSSAADGDISAARAVAALANRLVRLP